TREASSDASAPVTQFQARHILIRVDDATSDAQARAQAETLRARIAGGADFADVAREHSGDPSSKARGGDLGWFTREQFGNDFGDQVARLQDGEVSAPFRTQAGWHIVERIGSRQAAAGNADLSSQVRETIGRRKLEDQWNRFLSELRGEAFVDVRNGEAEAAPAAPADGG
ncbi:MAG TPA: peptidylprolyl isomerase, partial [Lysobacter sp.]|nr:peptidylprolyl isomerase [Lysobacter sp.]